MSDRPRLIEVAFPLKQASLDSVHEKNVRHGHISTLHIWPARRPLAACRAALIATLLPDPGTPEKRKELLERLGGHVVQKIEKKKMPSGKIVERPKEETVGGILHWGRESLPDVEWFREEIRKAYPGRAPKVLDPFAGGGAIPLEAMRLGCEATAIDINPVAWFILKCTLEYPQRLAGQKRPLPEFILKDEEFMEEFYKAHPALVGTGKTISKKQYLMVFDALRSGKLSPPEADLAWQLRAWGRLVLNNARKDLARFYPTYAGFEPLKEEGAEWKRKEMKLVPTEKDGTPDSDVLNAEFDEEYLKDPRNPRWVPKPTVAYLWARTVACKNCRAQIPLLKTRWLCKKDLKRVLLTIQPNADKTGVVFRIQSSVPVVGGNTAQRREHDKGIGQGTMTRNGAWCPCCGKPGTVAMTMEDIRQEGLAGRMAAVMTAVIVDGQQGKEYRVPVSKEIEAAAQAAKELDSVFSGVPFGLPTEPLPGKEALGFRVPLYGLDHWHKLFTPRQLLALGTFVNHTRAVRDAMLLAGYSPEWTEAVTAYLAIGVDRLADRGSTICSWTVGWDKIRNTFVRFVLPITWDFAESVTTIDSSGGYPGAVEWIGLYLDHAFLAARAKPRPFAQQQSAVALALDGFDIIVTDPPYYDAIPYSDLMDFFYVWLRRTLHGLSPEIDKAFREPVSPKWDGAKNDGELIDDSSRFGGDKEKSKRAYEDGMFRAFQACERALKPEGRLVIVFANKQPDAWETLVSAMIRAGFIVDGSWPIQTEMAHRTRALASAALSSSVWLVCKKRPVVAKPGWDNKVLEEMRERIAVKLRDFWDAGVRGPDFVWAATGPALEAYSKHPVVKKANEPAKIMEVHEFLQHVRRMVVNFVVGQVLTHGEDSQAVSGLDDITTYYLLHRNDFGLEDAPIGACILYAVSCGLSDSALADDYEILLRTGGIESEEEEEEVQTTWAEEEPEAEEGTGSKVKLRPWNQRKRRSMGYMQDGKPAPLIDQVHRLVHLWKAGDQHRVDEYIETNGIRGNQLFHRVLQSLVELSTHGSEERSILESISNHLAIRGATIQGVGQAVQPKLPGIDTEHVEQLED
jgi:putative DNA methylase